ncbi:MAG: S41 family peptidase [Bacteroidia bacterium]
MKTKYIIIFLLITKFVFGQSEKTLSSDEKQFYKNLIAAFRENSVEKEKIDWKDFEKKVLEKALIRRDSAIILALDLNGNPHTFYKTKERNLYQSNRIVRTDSVLRKKCNNDFKVELPRIGYVEVPRFSTDPSSPEGSKIKGEKYINEILDSIKSIDHKKLDGWIIDLRNNTGGNMWPMLIALTPFYPNSTLGYFIKEQKEISWSKANGQIWNNESSQTNKYLSEPVFYKLKNKNLKIAVLIGPRTSSSGEAVAISTKSIKTSKLFGAKTSGYSTANKPIKIAEDEFLIVTTSVDADYNKKEYWDGINPDINCSCEEITNELHKWFSE